MANAKPLGTRVYVHRIMTTPVVSTRLEFFGKKSPGNFGKCVVVVRRRGSREAAGEAAGKGGWVVAVGGVAGDGVAGGGVGGCGGTGGAGAGEHGQLLVCGKYHLGISFIIIVLFNFC